MYSVHRPTDKIELKSTEFGTNLLKYALENTPCDDGCRSVGRACIETHRASERCLLLDDRLDLGHSVDVKSAMTAVVRPEG